MDEETLANWERIKEKMEENGNTDNMFYKRACIVCKGGDDPLDNSKLLEE